MPELIEIIGISDTVPVHKLKPYLWKDELDSPFLLTKHMELYLSAQSVFQCLSWISPNRVPVSIKQVIFEERCTEDPLHMFRTNVENLPLLLHWGTFRRRPHQNGRWVRSREKALAHQILPYNPLILKITDTKQDELLKDSDVFAEQLKKILSNSKGTLDN